ncbi:hypothetical protein PTKIN_Ptkin16aG0117800 [Pterospermum kingtungense]
MEKSCLRNKCVLHIEFLLCSVVLISFQSTSVKVASALGNETDRLVLLALKDQLIDGSSAGALLSWNASLHFCGFISPSIGNLSFLIEANLSDDGLQGNFPREFGQLRRLRFLNLSHNNLQGNIPVELSNCSSLQLIYLNHNSLSGKIPLGFGDNDMKNLTALSLNHNNLTGSIPSSLGNLSSLADLRLADNHLDGTIPNVLGRLSNLKMLFISRNNLSGNIPSSIYNLSFITYFAMSGNKLSGDFAPEISIAFPKLEVLHIADNQFWGRIPRSVTNISSLKQFDISSNGFSGSVPDNIGNLKNLDLFNIGFNHLGTGKEGDLVFLSSLSNCSLLKALRINENRLGGVLPDTLANLSTQLEILYMGGNKFSGTASNQGSQQETSSAIKGTIGYLAPEYAMGGLSSPEGDIYSYGILLLEMITGKRPTDDLFQDGSSLHNFCKMALPKQLEEILNFQLLEQINEKSQEIMDGEQNIDGEIWGCLVSFTKVGVACSLEVPTERMKIEDAITELLAIKARLQQGTKLIHTP